MPSYQSKLLGLLFGVVSLVIAIVILIYSRKAFILSQGSFISITGIIAGVIITFTYWQTKWEELPPRRWYRGFSGIPMLVGLCVIYLTYEAQYAVLSVNAAMKAYGGITIAVLNIVFIRGEINRMSTISKV